MRTQTHCRYFSTPLLLFSIGLLSSCASSKLSIDKQPLDQYFETSAIFKESHTGLQIYDLEANSILYDFNSKKHFTPASNIKLLTYLAAINTMEDRIPSLKYCITGDTLYFTGTGDPTLLYPNFEYATTLDFLSSTQHNLVYIEKPMTDKRFGPGWSWDDYPYYYSAEKSSFPIYGNMVQFRANPNMDYIQVIPAYFERRLTITHDPQVNSYSLERKEFENEFTFKFNEKPSELEDELPFIYSNDLFLSLLSDTLKKPIHRQFNFPACNSELHYSVPTDSIINHILIESDNFLAEQILLVISNQFGDTLSSAKTIDFIMKNHLSELENEIHWVDGSGLSRYNQVTPNAMVMVLKKIYEKIPEKKLFSFLPESGVNGTLKTSFDHLEGKVHAKTGSMSHVYNLSGFLETNSGKTLIFSFMNNNFNVSFSELKKEMERVLSVFVNDD